ncbi:MAG: hypothetical protein ABL973_19855 [Micropepsaceae bacterium]
MRKPATAIAAICLTMIVSTARASDDPVSRLANDVCGARDLQAVNEIVYRYISDDRLEATEVAEAFGVATFLGDLGRCANRQAMLDAFFLYKRDKDAASLDVAFAQGRVAAKPANGPSASNGGTFQGSFIALGTAGEPPSVQ